MKSLAVPMLLMVTACAFDPSGPGVRPDADPNQPDAARNRADAAAMACDWSVAGFSLSAPQAVSELLLANDERDPVLTPDALAIYFSSKRYGTQRDIWHAVRPDRDSPFADIQAVEGINTSETEYKIGLSGSGLQAVVSTARMGGAGATDIWKFSRASTSDPFSNATNVASVNTAESEHDPTLSKDGLRLYYAAIGQGQDLAVAERASVDDPFGPPDFIDELNGPDGEADTWLDPSETFMLFASGRSGGVGGSDIYMTRRASRSDTWSAPALVPDINTTDSEGEPQLSYDGCELFFVDTTNNVINVSRYVAP